jgi:prepilin-type N-terminal cleavage/methylation domain-containing protein
MNARRSRGFTLIEMVVAIAISAVVIVFASMFITAPVDAYEAQSRRARLLGDAATAWPRIQDDLRDALPNSVRERVNGRYVVLEMLDTVGYARYVTSPAATFTVAGTSRGIFGTSAPNSNFSQVHLAVNNAGPEAYTQTVSMTPALDIISAANATPGQAALQLSAVPVINTNSPRNRVYLVRGFVAYLCDQVLGTMTRYQGTAIVANVIAHDTPAEFGGAAPEVVARGLTTCAFTAPLVPGRAQEIQVALTTRRNNESVTLLHRATLESQP